MMYLGQQPEPDWSDEFEMGRQQVIGSLDESIKRHLRFLERIRNGKEVIKYSEENINGQIEGLKYAAMKVDLYKTEREDRQKLATL